MRYPLHTDRRPDISRAHHRYRRLVAQYGAAPTHTAFRDAVEIITSWSTMNVLNLPPDQALDPAPAAIRGTVSPREIWSTRMAAHCYPATVELTRLLVDPTWTAQALASRAWADVRPTFAHLVSDNCRPEGMSDPLTLWRNDIRQRTLIAAAHAP
ncbi:hypothetical protein AXK56_09760 [Tsukamurella pulmonis]|nr:hypothetical protein AXK56_09760 [Tsukamurella pulmonis]